MRSVEGAISRLSQPDTFNEAVLGNVSARVHMHVIPRYSAPRYMYTEAFKNKNFGKNYSPYDPFKPSHEVLCMIRDALKLELAR